MRVEIPVGGEALFQWASEEPVNTRMARVADLEAQGWVRVRQHHWYKTSWLMAKPDETCYPGVKGSGC